MLRSSRPCRSCTAIHPLCAIEGGRVTIEGDGFPVEPLASARSASAARPARLVVALADRAERHRPAGLDGGRPRDPRRGAFPARPRFVEVAAPFATGLHQVDNPVFDRDGNLYVTYSGTRGQQVPVSIFRVRPDGTREPFSSAIVNPTSMAFDPDGRLYVLEPIRGHGLSRRAGRHAELFATDLGVACGLAFAPDGTLFVGDRSGTIFRVDASGRARRSRRCRPAWPRFIWRSAPTAASTSRRRRLARHDALYRI